MVGILAYGSLIDNPGTEIKERIVKIVEEVETPFSIEFARSSNGRSGAPTLVPVEKGGARVRAKIFVLEEEVTEQEAKDLVYRREINQVGTNRRYNPPDQPKENTVLVEITDEFTDFSSVVYTKITSNFKDISPEHLADLAIESAKKEGSSGRDGISYLIDAKRNGIETPLMQDYEKEILCKVEVASLEEAHSSLTS
jgi:cation transport regulator ChaC